jgi:hypothetical protein
MMQPAPLPLKDIHVPTVSTWWPWTAATWAVVVLAVLLVALAVAAWLRRRAWQRRIDGVLVEVDVARRHYVEQGDATAFAASVHAFLRRVARVREPASVAQSGQAWRDTLTRLAPGVDVAPLLSLDDAMYRPSAAVDADATADAVRRWTRAALSRRRVGRLHAPA